MKDLALEKLKYPIGEFKCPDVITEEQIKIWIAALEMLPQSVFETIGTLSAKQLETPYRPGGWTIRQLVHHFADSHHHCYTRFKWALTEDGPIIKAYEEKDWSELFDAKTAPIQLSLDYLKALHAKLVYLLKGLSKTDLKKYYIHPESNEKVTVAENIGRYAWHSNHHVAHLKGIVARNNW
ncbi:putative metal-dependent hydrolase [Cellulophaga baltica]|uniref:YfiT family bacillithiol transferase n=1 Tax=Cellulophaga TaxID=104264 RepID=UPI001C06882B|nr:MULTISPECIES: putative metal-dependent hydrolase [Cellulophaga]MBU2996869.1 putative metal-dependent hydrolase [Cellulophaga baltica]MDO6768266.1 putative metal-dependent hydrolase [Cellulophaga sp. 1_MG-2023]